MGLIMNWTGNLINPFDLKEKDFENSGLQVAITLSRVQRFWGQLKQDYSVLNHVLSSVKIYEGNIEMQKIAISHEIYEAMGLGDIPTPIKKLLPTVKEAENKALETFSRIYGTNYDLYFCEDFKRVDAGLMVMEANALMPKSSDFNWEENYGKPVGNLYKLGASSEEIKKDFLLKWQELFGKL